MRFTELFRQYEGLIAIISKKYSSSSGVPEEDFFSALSEAFWKAYRTFDETKKCSFKTWANRLLHNEALDVLKSSNHTYYEKVKASLFNTVKSENSEGGEMYEIDTYATDDPDLAEEIAHKIDKKNVTDQHKLIDHILESSQILSDPVMVAAIDGIKSGMNPNEVAASLGIHRNAVDRPLRRLSRYYNSTIHGDILDYFPDGQRIKREFVLAV